MNNGPRIMRERCAGRTRGVTLLPGSAGKASEDQGSAGRGLIAQAGRWDIGADAQPQSRSLWRDLGTYLTS